MAHRDWNSDGKINSIDKSLGHHYTQQYSSSSPGGSLFKLIVIIASIILLFGNIVGCDFDNRPKKCLAPGCEEERTDSSIYCVNHWYELEYKPWCEDFIEQNG